MEINKEHNESDRKILEAINVERHFAVCFFIYLFICSIWDSGLFRCESSITTMIQWKRVRNLNNAKRNGMASQPIFFFFIEKSIFSTSQIHFAFHFISFYDLILRLRFALNSIKNWQNEWWKHLHCTYTDGKVPVYHKMFMVIIGMCTVRPHAFTHTLYYGALVEELV